MVLTCIASVYKRRNVSLSIWQAPPVRSRIKNSETTERSDSLPARGERRGFAGAYRRGRRADGTERNRGQGDKSRPLITHFKTRPKAVDLQLHNSGSRPPTSVALTRALARARWNRASRIQRRVCTNPDQFSEFRRFLSRWPNNPVISGSHVRRLHPFQQYTLVVPALPTGFHSLSQSPLSRTSVFGFFNTPGYNTFESRYNKRIKCVKKYYARTRLPKIRTRASECTIMSINHASPFVVSLASVWKKQIVFRFSTSVRVQSWLSFKSKGNVFPRRFSF